MADTHINAFYAELTEAEKAVVEAQGRVEAAKQAIRDQGGVVPGDKKPKKQAPAEEPVTSKVASELPKGYKLDTNGKLRDPKGHFVPAKKAAKILGS